VQRYEHSADLDTDRRRNRHCGSTHHDRQSQLAVSDTVVLAKLYGMETAPVGARDLFQRGLV
jgi:hypothetical protein